MPRSISPSPQPPPSYLSSNSDPSSSSSSATCSCSCSSSPTPSYVHSPSDQGWDNLNDNCQLVMFLLEYNEELAKAFPDYASESKKLAKAMLDALNARRTLECDDFGFDVDTPNGGVLTVNQTLIKEGKFETTISDSERVMTCYGTASRIIGVMVEKCGILDDIQSTGDGKRICPDEFNETTVGNSSKFQKIELQPHQSDFNTPENQYRLRRAAQIGDVHLVNEMLENGVDINAVDNDRGKECARGFTALMLAAENYQLGVVRALLYNGANMDYANNEGYTALTRACMKSGHGDCRHAVNVVDALTRNREKIDAVISALADEYRTGHNGYNALALSIWAGNVDVVQILLNKGADPDTKYILTNAVDTGNLDIVQALLNKNVDLDNRDCRGRNALHTAADGGTIDMVELLIGTEINIDARDEDRSTALHIAASYRSTEVVQALIDAKVDVDAIDKRGNTALHIAVHCNITGAAQRLINAGARLDIENLRGLTAFQIAEHRGRPEIMRLFTHPDLITHHED